MPGLRAPFVVSQFYVPKYSDLPRSPTALSPFNATLSFGSAGGGSNNVAFVAGQNIGSLANPATTVGVNMPGNVTNGNTVLVGMNVYGNGNNYVFAAGDLAKSAGTSTVGTIVLDKQLDATGTTSGCAIYRVPITGTGSLSLTFTPTGGSHFMNMGAAEFSGMAASPYDSSGSGTNTGSGTSHTTGSITTANLGVIFYTASETASTDFTRTFSDTLVAQRNAGSAAYTGFAQYRITSATSNSAMTDTTGTDSSAWTVVWASYLTSGGVSSPSPTLFKQVNKVLTAALSFVGNLATTLIHGGGTLFTKSLTATLSFVGGVTKQTAKSFSAVTLSGSDYTTSFPATENPISESGRWLNGLATGLDWSDVRTTSGKAYGTQVSGGAQFTDSTAILTGSWTATQSAQATVFVTTSNSTTFQEVEIRLRSTMTAHSSTGYEILWSVNPSDPYCQIVKWNGAVGSFTLIDTRNVGVGNGDVVKATAVGSTISCYINNSLVFSVTDSTYSSGNPGIGFYLYFNSVPAANASDYGFTNFSATGGTGSAGLLTRLPLKALGATFSATATLSRNLAKAMTATLSFAASLIRKYLKTGFSATLSFIGNLATNLIHGGGTLFTQNLAATLSFAGALSRQTLKALLARLNFGSPQNYDPSLPQIGPFLFSSGPGIAHNFFGNGASLRASRFRLGIGDGTVTGNMYSSLYASTGTFNVNARPTGAALATSNAVDSAVLTSSGQWIQFDFPASYLMASGTEYFISLEWPGWTAGNNVGLEGTHVFPGVTASMSAASLWTNPGLPSDDIFFQVIGEPLTKQTGKPLSAILSFAGFVSASKSFLKSLTATLSFTGAFSVSKSFLKAFAAILSFSGVQSRSAGKVFSATLSVAASLIKRVAHTFSAILAPVGALFKAIRGAGFSATLSFGGNLTSTAAHFFARSFSGTLSFTGNLVRSRLFLRVLSATLNMTGVLGRQIQKSLAAVLGFSGAIGRAIRKGLAAVLSFAVFFFKGGAVEILAGLVTKCGAIIGLAGSKAKIGKAGSKLRIERTK